MLVIVSTGPGQEEISRAIFLAPCSHYQLPTNRREVRGGDGAGERKRRRTGIDRHSEGGQKLLLHVRSRRVSDR